MDNFFLSIQELNTGYLAEIATILGIPLTFIALIYTAIQIRIRRKVSQGQFWLEIEKIFFHHDDIHIKLRPEEGEWTVPESGPKSNEEWASVDDYMGLFEHCELLLRKKLLDWDTFNLIFSYRLQNILSNNIIVEKNLKKEKESWKAFLRLINNRKLDIPESFKKLVSS